MDNNPMELFSTQQLIQEIVARKEELESGISRLFNAPLLSAERYASEIVLKNAVVALEERTGGQQ